MTTYSFIILICLTRKIITKGNNMSGKNDALIIGMAAGMVYNDYQEKKEYDQEKKHVVHSYIDILKIIKYAKIDDLQIIVEKIRRKFRKKDYEYNTSYFRMNKQKIRNYAEKKFGETSKEQNFAIGVINRKIEKSLITIPAYLEIYRWILGVKPGEIL